MQINNISLLRTIRSSVITSREHILYDYKKNLDCGHVDISNFTLRWKYIKIRTDYEKEITPIPFLKYTFSYYPNVLSIHPTMQRLLSDKNVFVDYNQMFDFNSIQPVKTFKNEHLSDVLNQSKRICIFKSLQMLKNSINDRLQILNLHN